MTQFQKYALAVCAGLLLAAALGVSFLIGRALGRRSVPPPATTTHTDTLVFRDTVRERYPVEVGRWHTSVQLVPVRDTIRIRDTTYIAMDREAKEYRGDDYRAVVSGILPSLDEIAVYPKTVYLKTAIESQAPTRRARIGFGITAGPGIYWNGSKIQPGLGVAAGITLNF